MASKKDFLKAHASTVPYADMRITQQDIELDKKSMKANLEADLKAQGDEDRKQQELRDKMDKWMKPSLSIDRLRYNFDQGARGNRFNVEIHCPKLGIAMESLRCQSVSLPGRQLETADWSAYGATQKMPYQVVHDGGEVSLSFLCDSTFADRFIIDAWMGLIYASPEASSGNGLDYTLSNSQHPMFSYLNDIVGQVNITQMNMKGKKALRYTLYDAYPISFSPMQLGWDQTDSIMGFDCSFAFRTFHTEYANPPSSTALNRGRRALDAILDIGNLRKGGNSANNKLQRFSDRLSKLAGIFG